MRKILSKLLVIAFVLALPLSAQAQVRISAATFPVWLLTRQVVQDVPGVELDLILPASAGCPHDYVLSPQELFRLSEVDILMINGHGLDDFVAGAARALAQDAGRTLQIVNTGRNLEMYMLQHTPDEDEDGHAEDTHDDHDELAVNPDLFASPVLYRRMLDNAVTQLAEYDPEHAALYQANAEKHAKALDDLADRFALFAEALPQQYPVLTMHSALDYIVRDAGLQSVGNIQEHEGQEPAAARLLALTDLIRDRNVAAIFTEPQYPDQAGRTLAAETGIALRELDTVASGPADAPLDYYLTVMSANLASLEELFGQ